MPKTKQIKIRVNDKAHKSYVMLGLKDNITLYIEKSNHTYESIKCARIDDKNDGVYIFDIDDKIYKQYLTKQVFIGLDSATTATLKNDSQQQATYNKGFCSIANNLYQINALAAMCDCDIIPYEFTPIKQHINIGLIKAYKKDKNGKFIDDDSALSNPHNEIYTIDIEQEIQLRAFVYKKQTPYEVKSEYQKGKEKQREIDKLKQGNITKDIHFTMQNDDNIRWAFKIVDGSYLADDKNHTRDKAFPPLTNKISTINLTDKNHKRLDSIPNNNDYIEIEGKYGTILELKLADLFDKSLFNPNNKETLINKNIIFFAYDKNVGINTSDDIQCNAYRVYSDKGKSDSRIVSADRITSVELKIIETRFGLDFDGQTLQFLENERIIGKWNARSGVAIKNKINNTEIKPKNRASVYFSQANKDKSFYYDDPKNTQDFLPEIENNASYFVTIPLDKVVYMFASSTKVSDVTSYLSTDFFNLKITKKDDKNTVLDVAQIDNQQFKVAEKDNNNKNINLGYSYDDFIQTLLTHIKSKESITIPLKVKYQKRILILIERFKQSTESTMSRMNIFIDGKRVDSKGKFIEKTISQCTKEYEMFNPFLLPNDENNYAYILERNGPDSIGGELKLRIPEGRYGVVWHKDSKNMDTDAFNQNTLNLFNQFVNTKRNILIHFGGKKITSAKNSYGCLLISNVLVKSNLTQEVIDDVLQADSTKKRDLSKAIKKHNNKIGFIDKYLFGAEKNNIANQDDVVKHIEIKLISTMRL